MADQDLLIKIVTQAELAGAKALADANEREIGQLKVLAASIDDVAKREKALNDIRQKSAAINRQRSTINEAAGRIGGGELKPGAFDAAMDRIRRGRMEAVNRSALESGARVSSDEIGLRTFGNFGAGATREAGLPMGGRAAAEAAGAARLLGMASAAAATAVAALAAATLKGAMAAEEARVAEAKLAAAIKARGIDANDKLIAKYRELADQLQETSGIASDDWLGVLKTLTQYGSDPATIGMDAKVVENLAGVVGDLGAAASLYGRALEDNFEGFQRYGIYVDDAASHTEKLKQVWQQSAEKGAGQLAAAMSGLTGQFTRLKNNSGDVLQRLGKAATEVAGKIVNASSLGYFDDLEDALKGTNKALNWMAGKTPEVKGATDDFGQSARSAAISVAEFARSQDDLVKKSTDASGALGREVDAVRNLQRASDEVADAGMALEMARVDAAERTGKVTQEQAIRERASIRERYEAAKVMRAEVADHNEIIKNNNALQDLRARRGQQAGTVESLKAQAQGGDKDAIAKLNVARKTLKELDDRLATAVPEMEGKNQQLLAGMNTREEVFRLNREARGVGSGTDLELARREEEQKRLAAQKEEAQRMAQSTNPREAYLGSQRLAQLGVQELQAKYQQTASPGDRALYTEQAATVSSDFARNVAESFQSGDGKLAQGFAQATGALQGLNTTVADGFERMVRTIEDMNRRVSLIEGRAANNR